MNAQSVSAIADIYQSVKFIACFIAAFLAVSLSACGVSTPGGYVLGTTSYLEEFNRGRGVSVESITNSDAQRLARLADKEGR